MYPLSGRVHPDSNKTMEVHHPLVFSLYQKINHSMFKNNHSIEYYAQQVKEELDASDAHSVILSSEQFWLLSRVQIEKLLNEFSFFDEVYFVLYIRRQDKFLESLMIQNIKDDKPAPDPCMNYLEIIRKFSSFVNKKQIFVRIYEKNQLSGGSIFSDFLNAVGVPSRDDYHCLGRNPNPSFSRDELEFKRLVNQLPLEPVHKTEIRHILMQLSIANGSEMLFQEHNLLSPEKQRAIILKYKESNTQIAKEILGREHGCLFYEPLPKSNEKRKPYPGLSCAKIIEISDFLKKSKPDVFDNFATAVSFGLNAEDRGVRKAAETLLPCVKEIIF